MELIEIACGSLRNADTYIMQSNTTINTRFIRRRTKPKQDSRGQQTSPLHAQFSGATWQVTVHNSLRRWLQVCICIYSIVLFTWHHPQNWKYI